MSDYTWVDYIVIAIFFISIIAGFARGFVKEVISIITIVAAFLIASTFSGQISDMLMNSVAAQSMIKSLSTNMGVNAAGPVALLTLAISFLILFILVSIVGEIVNYLFSGLFKLPGLGIVNALLGGGFGFVRGYLICIILMFVVQLTPVAQNDSWTQSQYVQSFQGAVQYLASYAQPTIDRLKQKVGQSLQSFNSEFFRRDRDFYQLNNS